MRRRHSLENLTLHDPIEEVIDRQLGSPFFNDYASVETMIHRAIDRKYSRLHSHARLFFSFKLQGFTYKEISEITGYCERQIRRCVLEAKKNVRFHEIFGR